MNPREPRTSRPQAKILPIASRKEEEGTAWHSICFLSRVMVKGSGYEQLHPKGDSRANILLGAHKVRCRGRLSRMWEHFKTVRSPGLSTCLS